MKEYLEKLLVKEDLTIDESYNAMNNIMDGIVDNSNLAAFLIALKVKGESPEEVAGFAKAMRDNCLKIISPDDDVIDVCGTGGDGSGTFNISTAVSFVAAGAGVKVAKHGNKSVSSKCGSADVLRELGVNINLSKQKSEEALEKIGITFLFAPLYHPAMKHAAQVRKDLGVKTVFNMLGPLTNPAGVKKQLIGTFNNTAAKTMAQAALYLNLDRVCFVCCGDKFDEVYLGDLTSVYEYKKDSGVKTYSISNETFNYPPVPDYQIKGDTPKVNAKIILEVFENKTRNGAFHTIAANSALALYCAGLSDHLNECITIAEESILSGAALNKLNQFKSFSNT